MFVRCSSTSADLDLDLPSILCSCSPVMYHLDVLPCYHAYLFFVLYLDKRVFGARHCD